jgi:hypothetical protein
MKLNITVRKLHDKKDNNDDYIENPEECLEVLERLRLEAEIFLYDKPISFQRVITVIRKEQR